MRLQIASDLHIEYNDGITNYEELIKPVGDILILAGDIGSFYKLKELRNFLTYCSSQFTYVIYVIGNCEYYLLDEMFEKHKKMDTLKEEFKQLESELKNFFILDRSSIQIGDYLFTGCTLWSELKKSLPFNYKIKDMTSYKYSQLFKRDLEFIVKKSQFCKEKRLKHIVITHYVPIILDIDKAKEDLYMSDLRGIMDKTKIDWWICGHLHQNFNLQYNNTKIISNQRGKPGSFCPDYNKKCLIEI